MVRGPVCAGDETCASSAACRRRSAERRPELDVLDNVQDNAIGTAEHYIRTALKYESIMMARLSSLMSAMPVSVMYIGMPYLLDLNHGFAGKHMHAHMGDPSGMHAHMGDRSGMWEIGLARTHPDRLRPLTSLSRRRDPRGRWDRTCPS